jgi:DNA-binding Lrp family transcriptional regulator
LIVSVNDGNINVTESEAGIPWPDLDHVDLVVIRALQVDGRVPMAGMAKSLGMSVTTIHQRYERLRQRGLVRATALIDPAVMGRDVVAQVEAYVRTDVHGAAERLAALPEVAWLAIGADLRTVYLQVSTSSHAELAVLLDSRVRRAPGIVGIRSSVLLRNWSPVFCFGGFAPAGVAGDALWRPGTKPLRALDEADLALLRCLERDARMTITAMSTETGLSVPATRQRLVKLLAEKVVRLRTRPSPQASEVTVGRLFIDVDADSATVAQSIAALPNISFVSESTGDAALTAELVCASESQIREGYERACRLPGVAAVRIVRYLEVVVYKGHW